MIKLALRNARRNLRRTMLTAITVLLGTMILTVAKAWIDGVVGGLLATASAGAGHVRIVDPEYAAREDLNPLYANIEDADDTLKTVRAVPGVDGAYSRIITGVTLTVDEEIGDVFGLVMGAEAEWFNERLDLDDSIVAGRTLTDTPKEIVVGESVATEVGVEVGQELVLLGQTQFGSISPVKGTVVGIAKAGNALLDQGVFMPLADVQYLFDMDGGATELLVYTAHRDGAAPLAGQLRGVLGDEVKVEAWNERDPWKGLLAVVVFIQGIIVAIIVFVTALGVWNTMLMSVMERTNEIGVLRAMGMTRGGAVFLFVVEAVVIAIIGGVLGVLVGGAMGYAIELNGVELGEGFTQNVSSDFPLSTRVYADMTPEIAVLAFTMALVMAVLGSALPAIRAASVQPVTAMRSRR